jgi:hypothetical protein
MSGHLRLPLVLCATRAALTQAERLLPAGVVLENAVAAAIARGEMRGGATRPGSECPVVLHQYGVEVRVRRTRSASSGRKCWIPVGVTPVRRAA